MFALFTLATFIVWVLKGEAYLLLCSSIFAVAYELELISSKISKLIENRQNREK